MRCSGRDSLWSSSEQDSVATSFSAFSYVSLFCVLPCIASSRHPWPAITGTSCGKQRGAKPNPLAPCTRERQRTFKQHTARDAGRKALPFVLYEVVRDAHKYNTQRRAKLSLMLIMR